MEVNKQKLYQAKGIKVDEEGKIKLVFGTMNVIDHDGDVTIPGAIGTPQKVRMSAYNHSSWGDALPIGKGVVYESGDEMIFEGGFFLNTTMGKDTHAIVKEMGDLQEYSYGFDIMEASFGQFEEQDVRFLKGLKIYEVSPVMLGAGIDTRTLAIKDKKDTEGDNSKTFTMHSEDVLEQVEDFVKRAQTIAGLRTENGNEPCAEKNKGNLLDIAKALTDAADILLDLTSDPDDEVAKEAALLLEEHDTRQLLRS